MGMKASRDTAFSGDSEPTKDDKAEPPRILGLHGWRTSAKILKMQTAAMTYNCRFSLVTIDAPWAATGPPDQGISMFYPGQDYYEWFSDTEKGREGLTESITLVSNSLGLEVPYDGGLGFSQGGGILSLLLLRLQLERKAIPIKFVILIGGMDPPDGPKVGSEGFIPIDIPSLHLIGRGDHLKHRCERLIEVYSASKRTVLYHDEGHNIPSIRTGLYPEIEAWIRAHR